MSITFPTTLDTLPNPTSTDLMENATLALDHDQQHANANDAIEALEAKVGINGSAVTTSHDYKLSAVTGSAKALTAGTSTQSVTGLTLVNPVLTIGSDATGDLFFRNGSGVTARLAIGSSGQILQVSSGGIPEWIANPAAADATYAVKGVDYKKANAEYYAADAGSNDTYVITLSPAPTAYVTGMQISFKANTSNTGAATINVNGLGAKTIVKYVSTTLADGDIAAGMLCSLIYDGTNFVLQNPIANVVNDYLPVIGATTATALDPSNTSTTTITHNLGVIPRYIRITAIRSGTSPNNYDTISTGIATINNSSGAVIASYVSMNAGDSSYDAYYNGTNIAGVAGSGGANLFAPLSSISSTQMSITFAAVGFGSIQPSGTMTYIWEVSR